MSVEHHLPSPSPVVAVESLAHGGQGVGRVDGRVVFVDGAVPGDAVELANVQLKGRFSRAGIGGVVNPSPDRMVPPCPVFDRCGGCDWQMMTLAAQRRWKAEIVAGQLAHLGRVEDPPVLDTVAVGPGFGYRNRIDVRVANGHPALLAARSHHPVIIPGCPLVTGPVAEILAEFRPARGVDRATIRASTTTGESVTMRRRGGRWERGRLHEMVAGHRFQITGRAFFQVNTAGAEMLVDLVNTSLQVDRTDVLLDGYAGGGLFSATVGAAAGEVIAVESDPTAQRDLAVNAPGAAMVAQSFEAGRLPPVDLAVLDPPRAGLGRRGVEVIVAARPRALCYVSCDPASLARDAASLIGAGYRLEQVTPVDMFPQTHHIESVSLFTK